MRIQNFRYNESEIQKSKHKPIKLYKKIIIGVSIIPMFVAGMATAYATSVHFKLNSIEYNSESINQIIEHYDGQKDLTIVALNDSQGMNLNLCFWENSFPEYVKEALTNNNLNPYLVDVSSLKFNKTNHIDKVLKENLTIEEIKEMNTAGAISALGKVAKDIKSSIDFGGLATLLCDSIKNGDSEIKITDLIKNSKEPIILYYSGANDIMRQLYNNPASIKKYDENGEINECYLYSLAKAKDPETIKIVMDGIENNFKNILSINKTSKIFAYSLYVPDMLKGNEDLQPFIDIIREFNIELEALCNKYNAVYVSNAVIGELYTSGKDVDFHIDECGHKILASKTLDLIAKNINGVDDKTSLPFNSFIIEGKGLAGFREALYYDASKVELENRADCDSEYLKRVQKEQSQEIEGEAELIEDAIEKKTVR